MKEKLLPILKDLGERAAWTFVQGFLVTFCATGEFTKTALIAACMAGLSAVKTVVLEFVRAKTEDK